MYRTLEPTPQRCASKLFKEKASAFYFWDHRKGRRANIKLSFWFRELHQVVRNVPVRWDVAPYPVARVVLRGFVSTCRFACEACS